MSAERQDTKIMWRLFDGSGRTPQPQKYIKARILIADDDQRQIHSLQEILTHSGFSCKGVGDGETAFKELKENAYDLLLLDLHMPKMGGLNLLKKIHNNNLEISIIVISGDTSWENAKHTFRQGADDFLGKPYTPTELFSSIDKSLVKRRLKAEKEQISSQLELSEQLHRFLVNQSPDLIFILDKAGVIQFANNQFHTLLGYSKDQLIGKRFNDFLIDGCPNICFNAEKWRKQPHLSQCLETRIRRQNKDRQHEKPDSITVELAAEQIIGAGDDEKPILLGTYGVARDITKRKQAEATISYQAYHDLLTGLPNRSLFNDRLDQAIRQSKREKMLLGIMFLDLDRFKLINDTLGHAFGDRLLQHVARRIQECTRGVDTLARIGGDEFLLLLPSLRNAKDVDLIADKILQSMLAPFMIDKHELFVRTSIGIALFPKHGETTDLLIKRADMAMYEAKNAGRGTYNVYSAALDEKYAHKLSVEHGLRKSLENGHFELHYQPLIRLADRSLIAMEALIRWRHPDKGMLTPDTFIQEAEENGLIIEIGQWVLEQSMRDLRNWLDTGKQPVPISVNVSALQIEHPGFVDTLDSLLKKHCIPGHLLQLELTENVLMRSMHSVAAKLRQLGTLGIKIAIDDFGTGYSSLSYLKTLPIHVLKVDQTFMDDIRTGTERETIVSAIAAMARGMNLGLVAEGVEEEIQARYLQKIGCECGQGFLFSRPMGWTNATDYLSDSKHRYPRIAG